MRGARVYIGNIRDDVRKRDVEKFFKGFGALREITLKAGFGFVEFEVSNYILIISHQSTDKRY